MDITIANLLLEEWEYSRNKTSLPKEVVLICWQAGISGKQIYIPNRMDKTRAIATMVMKEIESAYMVDGVTFVLEKNARALYSHRFGIKKLQDSYGIAYETARKVARKCYYRWSYWFRKKEEPRLKELMVIAAAKAVSYRALSFYYKMTRQRLRDNQPVTAEYYSRENIFPVEVAENMIALAQESVQDCSWNIDLGSKNITGSRKPDINTPERPIILERRTTR